MVNSKIQYNRFDSIKICDEFEVFGILIVLQIFAIEQFQKFL